MHRKKNISGRKDEQGVVIALVAVFMLGVVGAMAALSIDVVTLYTARSEAQLAADGAALAGARVLANSGMTSMLSSTDTAVGTNAAPLAIAVATQVAANNPVGGRNLIPGGICPGQEICVSINPGALDFVPNPQVTVQVQRTDLPTFFARIWGRTAFTVRAKATAEAYNPSSLQGTPAGPGLPIAPACVKPWLLPNISPTPGNASTVKIFDPATGAIQDPALLGWVTPTTPPPPLPLIRLRTDCTTCDATSTPTVWRYYPGTTDPTTGSFPAPSASSCDGCAGFSSYQLSIAGCVQTPISCNQTVNIDETADLNRDLHTAEAVDDLTHSTGDGGDKVDTAVVTPPTGTEPFRFLAGAKNPVVLSGALAGDAEIMVSDSLVTVPVINVDGTTWPSPGLVFPNVQIIGFVQIFLNPTGAPVPGSNHIHTQVINLVGCGSGVGGATGTPILGNGASPVAVRLIAPPGP